jgi:hypothetical protein
MAVGFFLYFRRNVEEKTERILHDEDSLCGLQIQRSRFDSRCYQIF